jgi:hypothetical protein
MANQQQKKISSLLIEYDSMAYYLFSHKYYHSREFSLPDNINLGGKWRITTKCMNCQHLLMLEADHNKNITLNFKKLPYPCTPKYSYVELQKIKALINNAFDQKYENNYCLKIEEGPLDIGLVICHNCNFGYITSLILGYGFENRPPEPDGIYIHSIIGVPLNELTFLLKDFPDDNQFMFKLNPPRS